MKRRISVPPHRPGFTIHAAVFAAAFLVAGCGGPADRSQNGSASTAPQEFGLSERDLDARIDMTEALIAACMRTQGFEYIALDATTVKAAMTRDKSAPGLSGDDYVRKYGLGITTQFDKPLIVFGAGPENNAYLDRLPPADQTAFRRALWGETPDMNHPRAVEEEDFSTTGGCTRSSAERTYSKTELSGSYLNPGDRLLAQDARMIRAFEKWSECMRTDAFDYATPDDVDADLTERLLAVTKGQDPATLTGSTLDALHQLQDEERAIAAALTACEQTHVEPVQAKIEAELYGVAN